MQKSLSWPNPKPACSVDCEVRLGSKPGSVQLPRLPSEDGDSVRIASVKVETATGSRSSQDRVGTQTAEVKQLATPSVPISLMRAEPTTLPHRPHLDRVEETDVIVPGVDRVAASHRDSRASKVPAVGPELTRRARTAWKSR